jgi:hemerythrin
VLAEVIVDRFPNKDTVRQPYNLPAAARLGLEILDNAHEALLGRLNAAHRALSAGDEASARLLLEGLGADLATHFDIEEQIMQAMGFRGMRDHVRCHAASASQVEATYRASLKRGVLQIGDLDLCFQALLDEILRSDIDLKSHLQEMTSLRAARS